jgi:sigma-B regulation protein RsbU (phosphoserine phosphatase)
MIAISVISYTELLNLSGYSQDINVQLGFYASDNSKEALVKQAETYMSRLSSSKAAEYNAVLEKVQSEVVSMANYMGDIYKRPGNFQGRRLPLPNEVQANVPTSKMMVAPGVARTNALENEMRLISNAEFMFSNVFGVDATLSNAYLGSQSGINYRFSKSNAYNPDYDPRTRAWYTTAYNADGPIWLETYVDQYGFVCTTCAKSYKDGNNNTAGVVAADVLLSTMVHDISRIRIGETGYAFLLDEKGNYLAHPDYDNVDSNALSTAKGDYKGVLQNMADGKSSVQKATIDKMEYYIAFTPLPITGWSLGIAVEYNEIIASAVNMKSNIDGQALLAKEQIRGMLNRVMFRFILLTSVMIIVVLIFSILVSGSVTRPMIKLTSAVIEVGKGNLNNKIDIQSKDEIGVLADNFNNMLDDLKNYISNLSKVTAEKERIGAELNIARQIQASMLPSTFPPFPNRHEFDIFAFMLPAKEVGGDFYDFFLIGENKLAVVIADVSGKGVPASLFMVVTKMLIKNSAMSGKQPKEVFETVNDMLCENNDANMFVTAFIGILDIPTGRFSYVNAGHNPLLIKRANAEYQWLPVKPGFILAGMENMKYVQDETFLTPGDTFFMYTDGVTEARNRQGKFFTESKLLEIINMHKHSMPKKLIEEIKSDIDLFVDGAEQADDITMLVLNIAGPNKKEEKNMKEFSIEAKTENLDVVQGFITKELEENGCSAKLINQIKLAVEEVFVNIAHYAYDQGLDDVVIRLVVGDEVKIEFEDKGKRFNPLEAEDPDVTVDAQERDIGGLGIFIVKNVMDKVEYRREDNKNILLIKKDIS